MIRKLRSSCGYALAALVILMLLPGIGRGQVNIAAGNTITQDFSIGTSATAAMPIGWKVDKNTTVRSVGIYSAAVTATERTAGNNMSSSAGNGIYNYAAGDPAIATDRAVGGISSSSASKSVNTYVQLYNNGSSSITDFTISYAVEKYRNGSNAAGFSIQMYYSTDGTAWTSAGINFLTSFAADADALGYASAPGATSNVTSKTLSVSLPTSSSLYLAWNYSVTSGTTTSYAQALGIDDVSITANGSGTPTTATPTFNPTSGTYYSAQNVNLSCTTGSSSIYYTTDGTDPDDAGNGTLYSIAIPVSTATIIKARAYAGGYDPSAIASATYTFPTEVTNIAALRAGTPGTIVYKLTGEAVLTYQNAVAKQKYIQDATGAILIYDNAGIITTSYNLYDGITGIYGTLADYNGMLEFIPVLNTAAASSTGNAIVPEERTLNSLTSADQAKLIKVINATVDFTSGSFLATAQNINVTQDATTLTMRTIANTDYSLTAIPVVAQNITCLVGQYLTAMQISPRSLADFETYTSSTPAITVSTATLTGFNYVQGSGPSAEQTFTVEGANLTNDISIAASTNYEISKTTGTGFTTSLAFTPAETATPQTVYVRLKSGLAVADYTGEVINITSSPADAKTVTCSGSVTSTPLVSVTFQVNMVNETVSADGVHIAGNFNGWDPSATLMSNGGSGSLYSVTLSLNSTLEYQFKYINGNAWGSEELVPATCQAPSTTNRFVVIGDADYSIDPVCFSSCENCPILITFQVNMQNETVSGDGVYLAGDFTGWASGAILMTANGTVWSATIPLQASSSHEFKFVNGNPNTGGQWELFNGSCVTANGGNRFYTTPTANTTLDLVCFNSCDACPVADFVMINEVDSDTPGTDVAEFIELYDGGVGNTNLTGLVVVLYNGSTDLSYAAYDLDGYTTDANGYFVIGSTGMGTPIELAPGGSGWLQNGADAVTLFTGNSIDFPTGTPVTTTNLVDALVYGTADADDAGLLVLLNSGEQQVDESNYSNSANQSMQRIPNGSGGQRNTTTYDETDPTPGAENFIPIVEPTTSIWNGSTSSDWFEVSNWTNDPVTANVPPVGTTDVSIPVVATNYPTITDFAECNNITIASGASLIDEDNYLSVSGMATANRTIADATDDKWHLFISPIEESTQASAGTCFEGAYVDGYNEETGAWERLVTNDDVSSDQGYSINFLTGSRDLVFTGTLLSSPVSYAGMSYTPSSAIEDYGAGWHLVGNPYPCGIDTKLLAVPTNINAFAYVWNGISGNYFELAIGSTPNEGIIAPLQGFFVRTNDASNELILDNAAKVHSGTFYKSSNSASQMLSLSIEGNNYSDKAYVRFNPEATASFDQAFDAYKRAGLDAAPQLYSIIPNEKAAVNTLPDYTSNSNVALGLKVGASTSYTIKVSGIESFDASLPIRLDDLKLGTSQDLRLNPVYTFDAAPGDAENRFMLSFASVTAVNEQNAAGIKVVSENGIIRVTHNVPATGTVYLYSVSGQLLATSTLNKGETTLRAASTGVYLVRVVTGKTSLTRKMVVVQ